MEVAPDAQEARLWMPLPASNAHQRLAEMQVESAERHRFCADPAYGNELLCVERSGARKGPVEVVLRATVKREAYRVLGDSNDRARVGPQDAATASEIQTFLRPDALVPVSGVIAAEARKAVRPGMTDLEKARAMYDYLSRTFSYDKTVPGHGRGDALFACDVRRGNCSDVHSLFIGMARSAGIPARFHIGFPLPADRASGEVTAYHCWADFHVDGVGWVPTDISEAIQEPRRHEELFGGLDADRVEFTVGRDIVLGDALFGPQNFLIYPVGRVGDKPAAVTWQFHFEAVAEPSALSGASQSPPRGAGVGVDLAPSNRAQFGESAARKSS